MAIRGDRVTRGPVFAFLSMKFLATRAIEHAVVTRSSFVVAGEQAGRRSRALHKRETFLPTRDVPSLLVQKGDDGL